MELGGEPLGVEGPLGGWAVFSFRGIWGNWRIRGGKVYSGMFCARFLRVGGAFSFQAGAWRAQIRNRCVGG